ncbi:hypothetical protein KM043_002808 [Ampulex compressa]|nr:hypothetical protein KM043_002808 [Ampulex compressa]
MLISNFSRNLLGSRGGVGDSGTARRRKGKASEKHGQFSEIQHVIVEELGATSIAGHICRLIVASQVRPITSETLGL